MFIIMTILSVTFAYSQRRVPIAFFLLTSISTKGSSLLALAPTYYKKLTELNVFIAE